MTIAEQINAVIRRVVTNGDNHSVILEQTYPTTVADLWDACTNPERLPRWFEPIEGDLRPGGRYRLTDSGTEGTIETCERPSALRITWEYGGDVSRVEVRCSEGPAGRATLTLAHDVSANELWDEFGPFAAGIGWDISLLALRRFLSGEPDASPDEMNRYTGSSEGHEFLIAVATAWQPAYVGSGADPDTAKDAAGRAAEAYFAM